MTPLEILKAARECISDPKNWAQGAMAQIGFYGTGLPIQPDAVDAHCWCSSGAVLKAGGNTEENYPVIMLLDKGIPEDFPQEHCAMTRVIEYNDSKSHSEVLAMFDKTIEELEHE